MRKLKLSKKTISNAAAGFIQLICEISESFTTNTWNTIDD